MKKLLLSLIGFCLSFTTAGFSYASDLWSIGKDDSSYSEFFGAGDYREIASRFPSDIVVELDRNEGTSKAAETFPWILPGPKDQWAGEKSRTVAIDFELPERPGSEVAAVVLEIRAAAHRQRPPLLEIELNGIRTAVQTIGGITGDRILETTEGARWTVYRAAFARETLRAGRNRLSIRSARASWVVFDALRLHGVHDKPESIVLQPLDGFVRDQEDRFQKRIRVAFPGAVLARPAVLRVSEETGLVKSFTIPVTPEGILSETFFEVPLSGDGKSTEPLELRVALEDAASDETPSFSLAATTSIPAEPLPALDEIILVFKTHFDIGYTKLASEVIENYRTAMIDQALDVVDASREMPGEKQFVWTLPGWPLHIVLENQTEERSKRLRRALSSGRFVVHALPFTMHSETVVEEDWVRGLRFSSNISREFDLPFPTDAKMTDVPCHSWFLPTLLAHSGVTFMHEGTNSGSGDPEVPVLFFREGLDGSRVLTMHVNGYGSGMEPPKDWPYKTWIWLIHTGDNHGPPRPDEVEEYLASCEERFPGTKIRIGRLSDFGDAILAKEDPATIPVVRGDMPDTWIHGPMCDPQGQKTARAVHEQLGYLEVFRTLYQASIVDEDESVSWTDRLARAREMSLLYGEHTWGAALYWICNYGAGEQLPFGEAWNKTAKSGNFNDGYRRAMLSWEEHSDYIRKAAKFCSGDTDSTGRQVRFFNPLAWELTDYRGKTFAPGELEIDEPTDSDRKTNENDRFLPLDRPVTVSSSHFSLTVDPASGSWSLKDLKNDRNLFTTEKERNADANPGFLYQRADAKKTDGFLESYCIDRSSWVLSEFTKRGLPRDVPETWSSPKTIRSLRHRTDTESEAQTIDIVYEADAALPFSELTLSMTLYENRPEVRLTFRGKAKQPDTWPEAGYFCFPLDIERPQFRLGRLGGILDPARQIVRGSNRHFQWLRTGVAVFGDDGFGVGICPLDSPLVSLDRPGGWLFSKDYAPTEARVYFNLFNNQWTTNFRLWNEGDIEASFILWTFRDFEPQRDLVTPSLESFVLNFQPVYPAIVPNSAPSSPNGIHIDRRGINITAFGVDPDTGRLMLRLWEMAGLGGEFPEVTVRLPKNMNVREVIPCDLRHRPIGQAIPVSEGCFRIEISPYSPCNLQLLW